MPVRRAHRLAGPARSAPSTPARYLLAAVPLVVALVLRLSAPVWAAADGPPRVTLLGAGSSLSALIEAGDSRILLAAGDDPAAVARALDRAIGLRGDRIDLLIVAGTGADLAVPADLARDRSVRRVVRLGSPHPGRQTGDLPSGLDQAPAETRIDLGDLTLRIETVEIPNPEQRGDFDLAWRAELRHGAATVVILSDARHADRFAPAPTHGVLVVAADDDLAAVAPLAPGALVVNAGDVEGSEIRSILPPLLDRPLPVLSVHDGTALRLTLGDGGVELPSDRVTMVEPGTDPPPE